MTRNDNQERQGGASSTSEMQLWPIHPVDLWSPFLDSIQSWNGTVAPKVTTLSTEWIAFIQHRLKEDFTLPQHLVACKAPGEIVQIYSDFLRQAIEDYQRQFEGMARIGVASQSDQKDLGATDVEQTTVERPTREPRASPQKH
jgi:Phasin protein